MNTFKSSSFVLWSRITQHPARIFLVLCCIEIYAFLLQPITGADAANHLSWLDQFSTLQHQGILYPHWLAQSFNGLGTPTFYFYPPLTYAIGGLLQYIHGFSAVELYRCIILLSTIFCMITAYWYLRQHLTGQRHLLLGALLYAFAPYRFVDTNSRCALAEAVFFAILPLVLLGVDYARTPRYWLRSFAILSIAWMAAILCHVPGTMVLACTLVVYAIIQLRKNLPAYAVIIVALVNGSLLAAFYWYPIPHLLGYIPTNHFTDFIGGPGNSGYFLVDLFHPPFTIISMICAISYACIGMIWYYDRDISKRSNILLPLLILPLLIQIPPFTVRLWQVLFPLTIIQFSWRWTMVATLGIAMAIVKLGEKDRRHQHQILFLYSSLSLIVVLVYTGGLRFTGQRFIDRTHQYFQHSDAIEYIPRNSPRFTPTQLKQLATLPEFQNDLLGPSESIRSTAQQNNIQTFAVHFENPHLVKIHQFYWPLWKLEAQGRGIPTFADSNGLTEFYLPAGTYEAKYHLTISPYERSGKNIAIAGVVLFLVLLPAFYILSKREVSARQIPLQPLPLVMYPPA